MARFSINEMTTYRWTFEEDVQHCAEAGIPALGAWRWKLSDFGEEKGIELLAEYGLAVSSLHWAGGFTGSDGRTFKDSLLDAEEAIRLASALRADCLVVYSGSRGGHTQGHARRLLRLGLTEMLPLASECGVTLVLEPMPAVCAGNWTFLTDIDETLQVLDEFHSPHLKLAIDTHHFGHDPAFVSRLPKLASCVGLVHLSDGRSPPECEQNRCRLGEGAVPLDTIMPTLLRHGFEGYFDIKLMGEEIEASDYLGLIAHSRRAFEHFAGTALAH